MVKVIGETKEEISQEEKINYIKGRRRELCSIALDVIGEKITSIKDNPIIAPSSLRIFINMNKNVIEVHTKKYFGKAHNLAEKYEELGEKWTLKKTYE
ncbi:hypothetical protein CMI39_01565 [Candidatus Pacearchaeota archaeon]|jgi:hypothetical protein|nr:hypothetical protein [Candidatus Pacearchaeota archaeon]|tara:strand:+ start:21201 stop:21494 length:294 start_codon:yes stop_codon:yes gene_type:complete